MKKEFETGWESDVHGSAGAAFRTGKAANGLARKDGFGTGRDKSKIAPGPFQGVKVMAAPMSRARALRVQKFAPV